MKSPLTSHIFAAAALLLSGLAGPAQAQYVWIDEHGVKQYSDRPPSTAVPPARVLKQPGGRTPSASAEAPPAASASTSRTAAAAAPAMAPPSLAEQNAEFRKRRMEQAEKEKKAADENRVAEERRRHCERAAGYQKALDSGVRVASTDSNGERTFLSDEQRQREQAEVRRALADCK